MLTYADSVVDLDGDKSTEQIFSFIATHSPKDEDQIYRVKNDGKEGWSSRHLRKLNLGSLHTLYTRPLIPLADLEENLLEGKAIGANGYIDGILKRCPRWVHI